MTPPNRYRAGPLTVPAASTRTVVAEPERAVPPSNRKVEVSVPVPQPSDKQTRGMNSVPNRPRAGTLPLRAPSTQTSRRVVAEPRRTIPSSNHQLDASVPVSRSSESSPRPIYTAAIVSSPQSIPCTLVDNDSESRFNVSDDQPLDPDYNDDRASTSPALSDRPAEDHIPLPSRTGSGFTGDTYQHPQFGTLRKPIASRPEIETSSVPSHKRKASRPDTDPSPVTSVGYIASQPEIDLSPTTLHFPTASRPDIGLSPVRRYVLYGIVSQRKAYSNTHATGFLTSANQALRLLLVSPIG